MHRRVTAGGWLAAGVAALAVIPAMTVVPSLSPTAMAQAPGPELFAKEPKTPVEVLGGRRLPDPHPPGEEGGALSRQIPEEPAQRRYPGRDPDRYGSGSFFRLDDDPATRPFVKPPADALATASRRMPPALNGSRGSSPS